jgi:uncharacterized membrane protein YhaH (DUF805 family)
MCGLTWLDQSRANPLGFDFLFSLILTLPVAVCWVIFTRRRLADLRLNSFWFVAISVPFSIFVVALFMGRTSPVFLLILAAAFAIQLPLVWLKPHNEIELSKSENSDAPHQ